MNDKRIQVNKYLNSLAFQFRFNGDLTSMDRSYLICKHFEKYKKNLHQDHRNFTKSR